MQMPGPTLVVTEGDAVTVNLTNSLPGAAGNTSIVFAGVPNVTATGGVPGIVAQEATPGGSVTYSFTAPGPGTYAYYSGTQPDLQIEMGLFGAMVVKPKNIPANCAVNNLKGAPDMRLAAAAYNQKDACYDREYLFQFSEMMLHIHQDVEAQVLAGATSLNVQIEPYQPEYFLINGRSFPDTMDTPYAPGYPNQPYNAEPHMHPRDLLLMRVVGQGRIQHPFHFHGNHARVLSRDGQMLVSATDPSALAGPLLFTIPTVPGQSVDAIFTWTGQGLNWDVYGVNDGVRNVHKCNGLDVPSPGFDPQTGEYCPDHNKPIPVTPPDPQLVANGLYYGGTPYLGFSGPNNTPLPPGVVTQNAEAGYAYMWHSHNEREITTANVFPGGMMSMLIIEPPDTTIDETQ
jgi:FtsP/CotA-like multicopper oxidase with cupredoxin domain